MLLISYSDENNNHFSKWLIIKQIAIDNGFPLHYINRLVNQAKQPRQKNELSFSKSMYCTFDYIPQLYERLKYALQKYNINLIAKPPTKLKEFILSKIYPIPDYEKEGVYIIPFSTEQHKNLFYIGMTTRKLKEILKEYISDIKFNKLSTALSRMYMKNNIKINFEKAKMIISTSNHHSSIIRESIEILLRNDNACNDVISIIIA